MSADIELNMGDVAIDNGLINLVTKDTKLIQQTSKLISTPKDGYFHPLYGAGVYELIGRYQEKSILTPLSQQSIRDALVSYQLQQQGQEIFQEMSDEEILAKLLSVEVVALPDKTGYQVNLNIMNRKLQTLNVGISQGY